MGSSSASSARSALRFWRAAAALRPDGREEAVLRCVLMGWRSDEVEPVRMPGPGWGFTNQALRGVPGSGGSGPECGETGRAGHDDPVFAAIVAAQDGTGGSVRPRRQAGGSHCSAQPGLVAGDDQALDLACPLVDLGDLGVAEV